MKVGILQADVLREELQPTFGQYSRMFESVLGSAAHDRGHSAAFHVYDVRFNEYPSLWMTATATSSPAAATAFTMIYRGSKHCGTMCERSIKSASGWWAFASDTSSSPMRWAVRRSPRGTAGRWAFIA